MQIKCLSLRNGEIHGLSPGVPLAELEGEEVMVCDFDAINRGKMNFRLYGEISKFLEPVVLNLPSKLEDIMDSLIAGAARVIIPADIEPYSLKRMLTISDGIILPSRSPSREYFYQEGGKYLISEREVFTRFDLCYNVGPQLKSEKYINVENFPESLLKYI